MVLDYSKLKRSTHFPKDFMFGVATSSAQIEGGASDGGRGSSIWDSFAASTNTGAVPILDGSTPAVACDHYHKFKEDVAEMKRLGLHCYRFSISWPRLFPDASGNLNQQGVDFYNDLIDSVVGAGLVPFVTIYHWDLPQYLQEDPHVNGWATKNIIPHFLKYADACFTYFGDRIKHWITFNEIHMSTLLAYNVGLHAPGKSSDPNVTAYIACHHQLLCHAAVVKLYRDNYRGLQKGLLGMSADVTWYEPMFGTEADKAAVIRQQESEMGWILDPVLFGDYSDILKELLGKKLPRFTEEEIQELKNSIDFIGVNYYFAMWVTKRRKDTSGLHVFAGDVDTECHWFDADGNALGEVAGNFMGGLFRSCPWGLRKVLACIKDRYGDNIPIYITENGTVDPKRSNTVGDSVNDLHRIKFLQDHFSELSDSIRLDKVNVKGYFHWTFMDDWEWTNGFTAGFGLHHVDFSDPELPRKPKASAKWLSSFLEC